jgi:phage baseplate assembly protein W
MAVSHEQFGVDLRLLRNLEHQNNRNGGSDLSVSGRPGSNAKDLETLAAVQNLQQALLLRFLTRTGELTDLGHPDYGSRLYQLIGELNNEANRNRAKLYVLESLKGEPRVQEVISVKVTQRSAEKGMPSWVDRMTVDISISVRTIVDGTVLNLVFPFFLQGGARP